jgi:hypothetical protein
MLAQAEVRLRGARDDFSLLANTPNSAWSHSGPGGVHVSPGTNGAS